MLCSVIRVVSRKSLMKRFTGGVVKVKVSYYKKVEKYPIIQMDKNSLTLTNQHSKNKNHSNREEIHQKLIIKIERYINKILMLFLFSYINILY